MADEPRFVVRDIGSESSDDSDADVPPAQEAPENQREAPSGAGARRKKSSGWSLVRSKKGGGETRHTWRARDGAET